MKKITTLLGILFFIKTACFTQTYVGSGLGSVHLDYRENMAAFDFRNTSDLRGSRFTIDEFKEGELWMTENRHFTKEMTYRFDESENAIQVKYLDGKEIQLLSNEIYLLKIKKLANLRFL